MLVINGRTCILLVHILGTAIMNLFLITAMYGAIAMEYVIYCDCIEYAIAVSNDTNSMADSITVCESYWLLNFSLLSVSRLADSRIQFCINAIIA